MSSSLSLIISQSAGASNSEISLVANAESFTSFIKFFSFLVKNPLLALKYFPKKHPCSTPLY